MIQVMQRILIVGSTGQLGSTILHELEDKQFHLRVFVRSSSSADAIRSRNPLIDVVKGDLKNQASLEKACKDVDFVISTATSVVPRKGEKFGADEIQHYENLIQASKVAKVRHLIFVSALTTDFDSYVPEFLIKREIELKIRQSGLPFTIFRCFPFMDIYYALLGSRKITEGKSPLTLLRGFWLTRIFLKLTNGWIEDLGISLIPGNGKSKMNFICIEDVSKIIVHTLNKSHLINQTIELGGRESLSWEDVIDIYSELLNKRIRKLFIPTFFFVFLKWIFHFFSVTAENLMSAMVVLSRNDFTVDVRILEKDLGFSTKSTREFLVEKFKDSKK